MDVEKAKEFLRLNGLVFWRVEKNSKTAFKSPDDDEETNGKKTLTLDDSIAFFEQNMNLYGPGAYIIIGRKHYRGTAGESRFYFTKEGEAAQAVNNPGIGTIGEVQRTFDAKLEALKEKLDKEKADFLHQQEIKELKKQIKELEQKPTDISGALDKVSGVLGQAIQLYAVTKGGNIAGIRPVAQPVKAPYKPIQPAPSAEALADSSAVDELATMRVQRAVEKLSHISTDIATDLEAVARFAEKEPAQFQMILNQLKSQSNGNSTDE